MSVGSAAKAAAKSATVAYCILAVAVALSFARGQQTNAEGRHQLCLATQRSWDAIHKVSIDLTTPSHAGPDADAGLVLQVGIANARRAAQRIDLLKTQGPRTKC
jgi:hypothetical protein